MSYSVSLFDGRLPVVSEVQVQLVKDKEKDLLVLIDRLSELTHIEKSWLRCKVWCIVETDLKASSQLESIESEINRIARALDRSWIETLFSVYEVAEALLALKGS